MKKLDAVLCGVAGEYFGAAELSRRGCLASITLRNSRGVDILASKRDATKSVAIQVTTNQRGIPEWILTQKVEADVGDASLPENLFFVLVNLPPNGDAPAYHIISRRDVARLANEGHKVWLATPAAAANSTPRTTRSGSSRTPRGSTSDAGIYSGWAEPLLASSRAPQRPARRGDVPPRARWRATRLAWLTAQGPLYFGVREHEWRTNCGSWTCSLIAVSTGATATATNSSVPSAIRRISTRERLNDSGNTQPYGDNWGGKGDLLVIPVEGECSHIWEICFGFHKGETICFARTTGRVVDERIAE